VSGLEDRRHLVVGLGRTGAAVVRALRARGVDVRAVDDRAEAAAVADELGVPFDGAPDEATLEARVRGADVLLPSPGVPDHHPVFELARRHGTAVWSEFDLAGAWDDRPLLAVTGTNGKTTVTELVTAMLEASGTRALAVGNTDIPLVEGLADPAVEVFVVEASSFRLAHSSRFVPTVATWLNFAPDHLDAHRDLAAYEAAKATIWADPGVALAVANGDDPVVRRNRNPRVPTVLFGRSPEAEHRVDGDRLLLPSGEVLATAADLWRAHPHDLLNAAAATATALGGGASLEGIRAALATYRPGAHRQQVVAAADGVTWVDDSKATSPHATLAALEAFESVVLIAGGHNKGLDLRALAAAAARVRAVVAIGDAAEEVADAFAELAPVRRATSMDEAVHHARALARQGDVVLLSPGCASFDWYRSYGERGLDFVRAVHALLGPRA
jgi:UDP-N-acetylmuramoylalanine--D-glutamate ligase